MRSSAAVVSTVRIKYTLLYYGIDIGKYHILLKQRRVAGETGLMKALRGVGGGRKDSESYFCLGCFCLETVHQNWPG